MGVESCSDPRLLPNIQDSGADGAVDARVAEMAADDASMPNQPEEPGRVSLQNTSDELPPPGFPVIEHLQFRFQLLYSRGHVVTELLRADEPGAPTYEFRFGYTPGLDRVPAIGVFSYPLNSPCRDRVPNSLRGEFGEYGVPVYAYEGTSNGPMPITTSGFASEGVVLSNLSNQRTNQLGVDNIHPSLPADCRNPTLFEFRGVAFLRQVTLGVRMPATMERCRSYCDAQSGNGPDCLANCNVPDGLLSGSINIRFNYLNRNHWWENMRFVANGSLPSESIPSISYDRSINNTFTVETPILLSPSR